MIDETNCQFCQLWLLAKDQLNNIWVWADVMGDSQEWVVECDRDRVMGVSGDRHTHSTRLTSGQVVVMLLATN